MLVLWFATAFFLSAAVPGGSAAQAAVKITASTSHTKAASTKIGSYRVKVNRNDAYILFKAPKKGKYIFTLSGLTGAKKSTAKKTKMLVTLLQYKEKEKKMYYKEGKSSGKKDNHFYLATEALCRSGKVDSDFASVRKIAVSLKKKQKLYLQFYGVPESFLMKLKIQKK